MKDNFIRKSVLVIVGPTGSGKSAVGILTAQKLGGEIISADARQIYKYMEKNSLPFLKER
jgi:tRNA dimethylallyltransferase